MSSSDTTNPPPSGNHEHDPNALSVAEARQRISAVLTPIAGSESVALRSALGRVTAAETCSPFDVPPYPNSAMDGYAVRCADLESAGGVLELVGTAWAGQPFAGEVKAGQCVRIMTGAKMPAGADTVVMQEDVVREEQRVHIGADHRRGQNVRQAGEDIKRGASVLAGGELISPAAMGLLASLGIGEVRVRRRLRVAFFSTGDELRSIGEPLGEGQIYDSNRYTIHGMLRRLGTEVLDLGVVPDQPDRLKAAFEEAAVMADVVISSGGVSVGDADYVKDLIVSLGQVEFWKIAMKPGRPLAFGRLGDTPFFGLPGNPVSVMATFYQLVQPALRQLMGCSETAPLSLPARCLSTLKKRPGRMDFQRGILERDDAGQLCVHSTGHQGSHVLSSMSHANCFIVLPADAGDIEAGSVVEVQPFSSFV